MCSWAHVSGGNCFVYFRYINLTYSARELKTADGFLQSTIKGQNYNYIVSVSISIKDVD